MFRPLGGERWQSVCYWSDEEEGSRGGGEPVKRKKERRGRSTRLSVDNGQSIISSMVRGLLTYRLMAEISDLLAQRLPAIWYLSGRLEGFYAGFSCCSCAQTLFYQDACSDTTVSSGAGECHTNQMSSLRLDVPLLHQAAEGLLDQSV